MKFARLLPIFFATIIVTAHGATLSATTTTDSGVGSLRAQIAAAATGDTVAIIVNGTISLTSGDIVVSGKNLTIAGPGANNLTITTNATTRALRIVNAQCSISGITFNNCKGLPGDIDTGGAILVDNFSAGGGANVTTISDCSFTNNQSGWGGAVDIFNGGLVMSRCTFSGKTPALAWPSGQMAAAERSASARLLRRPSRTAPSRTIARTAQQPASPAAVPSITTVPLPTSPAPVTLEHCTFAANTDAAGVAGAVRGNYTGSYHTWANVKNSLLVNNQAPAQRAAQFRR